MTSPGLVVYTAIFGGRDTLKEPGVVTPGCRYVCFTDEPVRSDVWQIVRLPSRPADPRREARRHKILAHRLFDTEYSVWVDGSFRINSDVRTLIDRCLCRRGMALFKHPDRDCIFEEAEVCLALGLDDPDRIHRQVDRYRMVGFPSHVGLVATCVLLRRHTGAVAQLNDTWWSELEAGSVRDQLSFNFAAWRLGLAYATIPGNMRTHPKLQLLGHRL